MKPTLSHLLLLTILLLSLPSRSEAQGTLTLAYDQYTWLVSDNPALLPPYDGTTEAAFTYPFTVDGFNYELTGSVANNTNGSNAFTAQTGFLNNNYPQLHAENVVYFMAQLSSGGGGTARVTYHLNFNAPLPEGTLLAVVDVDANLSLEYAEIYSPEFDLYDRFLATVPNEDGATISFATRTPSTILYSSDENTPAVEIPGVRLDSKDHSNAPSDVSLFDVGGLQRMVYIGGDAGTATGQGNGFAFLIPVIAVPEPSSAVLTVLAGMLALRRRRPSA
jgi:hypothetical protein